MKVGYRKIRKQLTPEEAREQIQITQIQIDNIKEEIATYHKQPLTGIIAVVIASDYGSLDKAIETLQRKIDWCNEKIKDLQRFV